MARDTGIGTEPPTHTDAVPAPPRPASRAPLWRRVLWISIGVAVPLIAGGTCGLPRAELTPGGMVVEGGYASGPAAVRYRAGPLRRLLLGDGYREAWAAPIRVPVLDLAAFAGGLTPVQRGGGNQTRGLHLRGADGRLYVFRSVDKDQGGRLRGITRATLGRVRQDQVSALHPAAALVADGVMTAAGIPHPQPRLVVMPDNAALGPYRRDFAGLLGILEVNPRRSGDGVPGLEGATAIAETEEMLPRLRSDPTVPVDARAYLSARLADVYLGDWDRHEGQWRWARIRRGGAQVWAPLPRDRDYALADYGGIVPRLARAADRKIVRFDAHIRDLEGLLVDAEAMDRQFLCPLPAAAWDSIAAAFRRNVTDEAIAGAVRRMPPPYVRLHGDELAATLRARRERLPAAARAFRERLHAEGCASSSTDKN
jgi:hypothetical protein